MYVSNIVTSLLNAYRVLTISNTKINISECLITPLLSGIVSLVACKIICEFIIIPNNIIDMIFKIGIIGTLYIILLFLFGVKM